LIKNATEYCIASLRRQQVVDKRGECKGKERRTCHKMGQANIKQIMARACEMHFSVDFPN